MLVVVALGGNALLKRGEKLSLGTQKRNVSVAVKSIKSLAKHRLVITHGNAPQVGNIMLQVEAALGKAYPVPLHVAVAESEGEIGFLLEQALRNEINKPVASVLTQVLIDRKDHAFRKPTKPIGPYYSRKHAALMKRKGWRLVKINDKYRRVVASPRPLKIIEADIIKKLASMGVIIIAAGGGGIPVYKNKNKLIGIDAVIDKDLASTCLAKSIQADALLILTDVPSAYLNYGMKNQKAIKSMTIKQARQYIQEGHFAEGSMLPKVEAAIDFLSHGGKKVMITNFASVHKALRAEAGTTITR